MRATVTAMTSTPTHSVPPTLRARSPEDLLALVPVVLGFEPAESVVMLTFGAAQPFHARVDLPERRSDAPAVAALLLDPAAVHRVGRVVLLLYSADPDRRVVTDTWRALRSGCRERGLDVIEALRVSPTRYHPLLGGDPRLREIGVPYDVSTHPFRAQAVLEGRVTRRTRADLAAGLASDPRAVAAVAAAAARTPAWPWEDEAEVPSSALLAEGEWVEQEVERHLDAGTVPDDAAAARLLRALTVVAVRDAAWSRVPRPRAGDGVRLFTDLLRRAPDPWVPPVAALLAWAAWQAGEGALAWCALDRCEAVDRRYPLAQILAGALARAVPPSAVDACVDWRSAVADHDRDRDDPGARWRGHGLSGSGGAP